MSAFIPRTLDDLGLRSRSDLGPGPSWEYVWNHTYLSPLAMAEFPPPADLPTLDWLIKVAERVVETAANSLALELDAAARTEFAARLATLRDAVARRDVSLSLVRSLVADITRAGRLSGSDRPQSIEDYAKLFQVIGLPPVASDFNQDSVFAAMRTSGPNPLMLQRVIRMPDNFPVTEAQYRLVIPGDSLAAALAEGRAYVCDYQLLSSLVAGENKFLYVPIALFAAHPTTGALVPVAIQTQQQPAGSGQPANLFVADGSPGWLIAKTIVEMADGNVHEAVSHLGRTHLLVEPFVVATGRNLPAVHPVTRLLWPHFEGTLFINFAAVFTLLAKGGAVDQLLQGTIDSSKGVAVAGLRAQTFNQSFLPDTFRARGVTDLKEYAYRDDSLLHWDAIRDWVSSYLAPSYPTDAAVLGDAELQKWCLDLISDNGGRVAGFGINNQIPTRQYLADALTLLIFTASVQHAAVNFPQYDLMSYCPNMPLACYSAFPGPGPATAATYLDLLPPMSRAKTQQQVGFVLGSVHYTELGHYPDGYFTGAAAEQLSRFRQRLAGIGDTIRTRNALRRPYATLLPDNIPQSINI